MCFRLEDPVKFKRVFGIYFIIIIAQPIQNVDNIVVLLIKAQIVGARLRFHMLLLFIQWSKSSNNPDSCFQGLHACQWPRIINHRPQFFKSHCWISFETHALFEILTWFAGHWPSRGLRSWHAVLICRELLLKFETTGKSLTTIDTIRPIR